MHVQSVEHLCDLGEVFAIGVVLLSRLITMPSRLLCNCLGFLLHTAHSKLQVLYSPRDYRNEGASASEWKEATVRSSTEVVFQLQESTKVRKFKLSSVSSMSLSA